MTRIFLDMYLAHNLGDDLFLHIIANRYPNCKFTINYYKDDYKNFLKNYKNIETRVTLKNRIIRKLGIKDYINDIEDIAERNDALIFLSGSYFMEPFCSNYKHDFRNILIETFKNKNKSIFVIGSNFGPYTSSGFFNHWKDIFSICDDICFREQYSYNLFKELNNVRLSNDVVLGLDVNKYKKVCKAKIAGFSIVDVRNKIDIDEFYNSYIDASIKSIKMFIKKGYTCVLMSFCEVEGDLEVINSIINLLSEDERKKVSIYKYYDDLEEAINLISSFEVFIASRFHANILGLLLNVCTIPVIYSEKTLNVLTDLGLKNIAVNLKDLNSIYDEKYINKRLREGNVLDKTIFKNNNQFEILDKLVNNENKLFKKYLNYREC